METSNLVRIYVRKEGNGVRSLSLKKRHRGLGQSSVWPREKKVNVYDGTDPKTKP